MGCDGKKVTQKVTQNRQSSSLSGPKSLIANNLQEEG